mgnify:CR=1 FL=1
MARELDLVLLDALAGQDYSLPYDKLILSPGAQPVVPNVPGGDLPGGRIKEVAPDYTLDPDSLEDL